MNTKCFKVVLRDYVDHLEAENILTLKPARYFKEYMITQNRLKWPV